MPPSTIFAPWSTASWSIFWPRSRWRSLIIGPRPTSPVAGSPTVMLRARSASAGDVVVEQVARDDVAPGGDARLALVVERRPGADHRGLLEVGVVEDEQRVVAAELERALLELAAT